MTSNYEETIKLWFTDIENFKPSDLNLSQKQFNNPKLIMVATDYTNDEKYIRLLHEFDIANDSYIMNHIY